MLVYWLAEKRGVKAMYSACLPTYLCCCLRNFGRQVSATVFILTVTLLAVWLPWAADAQSIPSAPTNLVATAVSAYQIDLSWSDTSTNEDGFMVERSLDGTNFTQIAQLLANVTNYYDNGWFPNTIYYFRVRAFNGGGNSNYSRVASANPPALCPTAIVNWGSDQTPTGLTGIVELDDGLALESDGTVVGWGGNEPPPGLTGVVAIAVGDGHSLALKADGTVVGWGNNDSGQATPPDGLTGVVSIAAGGDHSLAVVSDGTVVGWGDNGWGQAVPPPGLSGVVAVAAGEYHSLVLKSDGTVVGWGFSEQGDPMPPPGLSGVVAIAAGEYHSLGLKSDGTVIGWGDNDVGQSAPPVGLTGVIGIAAGGDQSFALKSDGTVVGWGNNDSGQATPPVGLGGVVAIAGNAGSLALTTALSAPSAFTANAGTSNQINLAWTDNTIIEDGFKIERAPDVGGSPGNWTQIATVGPNIMNYTDTGLTTNKTAAIFWYRVYAYDVCTNSPVSDAMSVMLAPPLPSELYAVAVSSSQIALSWQRNHQNEIGFDVERSTNATSFGQIGTTGAGVTSYLDTNLHSHTTYYYRVRAFNAVGRSAYSNTNGATTYFSTNITVRVVKNNADSGVGSLRQTLQDANSGDSIVFASSVTGTVSLINGELLISKSLTIAGPGMGSLAISCINSSRILNIGSNTIVAISGLTIRDGHAADGASGVFSNLVPGVDGQNGGGICNHGRLTLSDCSLFGNSSGDGGNGGSFNDASCEGCLSLQVAVSSSDASLPLDAPSAAIDSFGVDDIEAFASDGATSLDGGMGGNGGGIYNDGTLVLNQCVISGNSTGKGGNGGSTDSFQGSGGGNGGGGGSGGGIYSDGLVILTNCSVTGNLTGGGGNGGSAPYSAGHAGNGGAGAGLENVEAGSASFSFFVANHTGGGGDGGSQQGIGAPGGAGGDGAGINNIGIFSVDNSTFSGNSTSSGGQGAAGHGGVNGGRGGNGGGGANSGNLIVISCVFDGNLDGGGGDGGDGIFGGQGGTGGSSGGLQNEGTMNVTACTLSHNFSGGGGAGAGNGGPGGSGGGGGAIQNHGTLIVTACTLYDNKAGNGGTGNIDEGEGGSGGNGGGVDNGGTLTVTSCTFSGNAAGDGGASGDSLDSAGSGGDGGGICNNGLSVAVVASTIVGNSSGNIGIGYNQGPSAYGDGGGIANLSDPTTFSLLNTLLSSNSVPSAAVGPDASGAISSLGHNLVSIADGSSGFDGSGDQTGTIIAPLDAHLGPLQDNGGPTFTCLLLPGSPAIDAGDDAILEAPYNLATDQRGQPRRSGTHVDIGAVEVPVPDVVTEPATDVEIGRARVNGSANPNGSATIAFFRWGATTNYGNVTAGMYVGSGASWADIAQHSIGPDPGSRISLPDCRQQ
jgi:hypothetical protein